MARISKNVSPVKGNLSLINNEVDPSKEIEVARLTLLGGGLG